MAYTYTALATEPDNTLSPGASIPVGTVLRYNNILLQATMDLSNMGGISVTESGIKGFLGSGWLIYVNPSDVGSIGNSSTVYTLYVQSGAADVTLTDKTKSFALGVMTKINAIITKVNSLTGRVAAVETLAASKAAIDDTALASTSTTLSASKIVALNATVLSDANSFATNAANEAKAAAISQLAGVDGTQLQALNELQAALQANSDADGVIATDLLNKVDYSKSQTLTDAQAAQARANIKFDSAVAAAMLVTVGDVSLFDPDAILATALSLN